MKISSFPRLNKQDFREAPEWFSKFLDSVNPILDQVTTALQGRLTLGENHNSALKKVRLYHEVEYSFDHGLEGTIEDISVAHSDLYDFSRLTWRDLGAGRVAVKISWESAPSLGYDVKLRITGN